MSDQVRNNQVWPVKSALDVWNTNGVIHYHYTTKPCAAVKGTCIPVVAETPSKGSPIAYASLVQVDGAFIRAKVTLVEDRGWGMNFCTLMHEFGHVTADIPHGWWIEGGEAPSVMNGECDKQLQQGITFTLPEVDRWYVQEVYRAAALAKATKDDSDDKKRVREIRMLREVNERTLWSELEDKKYEPALIGMLVVVSGALGASGTLLVQRLTRRR